MIKTFCDACGKEIVKGDEFAQVNSIEKEYRFNKKTATGIDTKQVNRLACGECFIKIKKVFEDGQRNKKETLV